MCFRGRAGLTYPLPQKRHRDHRDSCCTRGETFRLLHPFFLNILFLFINFCRETYNQLITRLFFSNFCRLTKIHLWGIHLTQVTTIRGASLLSPSAPRLPRSAQFGPCSLAAHCGSRMAKDGVPGLRIVWRANLSACVPNSQRVKWTLLQYEHNI